MISFILIILLILIFIIVFIILKNQPKENRKINPVVGNISNELDFIISTNRNIKVEDLVKKGLIKESFGDTYFENYALHLFDISNKKVIDKFPNLSIETKNKKIYFLPNYHQMDDCIRQIIRDYKNESSSFIMIDGEPNNCHDLNFTNNDMIISTKLNVNLIPKTDNYIYMPYYVYDLLFLKKLTSESLLVKKRIVKNKFCAFAYSNCMEKFKGVVNRKNFYYRMQEMTNGRIDNLGRCYNNNSNTIGNHSNNNITFEPYKFVIAFENEQIEGYISEKLTNPMLSGSIPIYLGASDVNKHFNPKSFINVDDFETYDDCINYILEIDRNDTLYKKILSESWFNNSKVNKYISNFEEKGSQIYLDIFNKVSNIDENLIRLPKYFKNQIYMGVFSDGINYKYNRIVKEALTSNYFDRVLTFKPKDINIDFMNKHYNFISSNPKGYGYYIWKPQCILQALEECQDGDYLIWLDSGFTIQSGNSSRMKYYLEQTGDKGILSFKIKYIQKEWCKKFTINYFKQKYNISDTVMDNYLESNHIASGSIIFRKCEYSINFVKQWIDAMSIYENINDNLDPDGEFEYFKEHRHDQSSFSLLCYIHDINYNMDNFSDYWREFENDNGDIKPLCPTRLKL